MFNIGGLRVLFRPLFIFLKVKKYISEFIGTFMLVFCGTGSIVVNEQSEGGLGIIGIAMVFGIIVTSMIYVFGNISGGHFNPAVTIGALMDKSIAKTNAVFFIVAQITGAILASLLLMFVFPNNHFLGATFPSGEITQSFLLEFILTFVLMIVILAVTQSKIAEVKFLSGALIGICVTGIVLFAGPVSGGSFNPARSIAPALVSGKATDLWIYIVAPILGALGAAWVWKKILN